MGSGQILGILKQMGDEMKKGAAEAAAAEADAIKMFDALMAAKKKEVLALTKEIETKLERVGTLGVEIAQMKNDLGDTEENTPQRGKPDAGADEHERFPEEGSAAFAESLQ